jgi:hypothetical protein
LKAAWKNLLGGDELTIPNDSAVNIENFKNICDRIEELRDIDNECLIEWLESDSSELGYPVLTDEQIIALSRQGKSLSNCFEFFGESDQDSEDLDTEDTDSFDPDIAKSIENLSSWARDLKTADPEKVENFQKSIEYFSQFNQNLHN